MSDGKVIIDTDLDASGFSKGLSKLGSVASTGLKATTTAITAVGGALVACAGYAVKTGAEFESAMSRVQAISGATGSDFEKLEQQAISLGASTAFSATECANGMENLASAGFTVNEITAAMPGMLNLAASSGEDLATSADIAASTLRGFGLEASEAAHVADVLAKNAADTNAAVADTGEAMKYVAPVAHSMGLSLEEVAASIGIMSNAGIKGSQAGTTLRSALSRLAKPTSVMREKMDELDISFYDSEGKMKSLTEIVSMLQTSMSGLTEEQKQNALVTLFGQESLSGMLALIDAGPEQLAELTNSLENCDGAAEAMAETMMDNLSGAVESMSGAAESLGIMVYQEMEEPLKELAQNGETYLNQLADAFQNAGFEGLVSEIGVVFADMLQQVVDAAPRMIEAGQNLISEFIRSIMDKSDELADSGTELASTLVSAVLDVTGEMVSAGIELFRKLLEGLAGHADEIGQSAADMVTSIASAIEDNLPLIIQAGKDIISAFCDGMSEELPGISALLEGFLEGFVGTAGAAIEGLTAVLSGLFDVFNSVNPGVMEALGKAIGTIAASIATLKVAKTVAGSVSKLFTILQTGVGVIGKVVEGFALWSGGAGTLAEVITLEFPKIGGIVTTVGGGITGAVSKIVESFALWQGGAGTLGEVMALEFPKISGIVTAAGSAITEGFTMIVSTLGGPVTLGIAAAIAALIAIIINWDSVKEFLTETVPEWFNELPDRVGEAIDTLISAISEWGSSIQESASEAAQTVIDTVVEFFKSLPDRIMETLSGVGDTITEWGSSLQEMASEAVSCVVEAIVQFFTELPYNIGFALGTVIGTLVSWGVEMATWVTTNIPLIITSIVQFFAELPGNVQTWLSTTLNNMITWGSQMLTNAQTTASNVINAIVQFFAQLPGNVQTWISTTLNNFIAWGSNMLSTGRTAASNVISAIGSFFSQLPSRISSGLSSALQKVASWGSDLAAKGRAAASMLVSAVVNGVSGLPGKMVSVGQNIVSGVWRGIQGAAGWFRLSVKSFFSGIVDGVKGALGINSPSKVFANEIGKWILPGVTVGVEKTEPEFNQKMEQTSDEMLDAFIPEEEAGNFLTEKLKAIRKLMDSFRETSAIDTSELVGKMQRTVNAEVGSVTQNVTVKSNSGSGQIPAVEGEKIDYGRMGNALISALSAAGLKVEMDERELGRLIAELA